MNLLDFVLLFFFVRKSLISCYSDRSKFHIIVKRRIHCGTIYMWKHVVVSTTPWSLLHIFIILSRGSISLFAPPSTVSTRLFVRLCAHPQPIWQLSTGTQLQQVALSFLVVQHFPPDIDPDAAADFQVVWLSLVCCFTYLLFFIRVIAFRWAAH